MNTSSGAVPGAGAHAGQRGVDAVAPSSTATTELATPSERLWWAWMPSSVLGSSTSR